MAAEGTTAGSGCVDSGPSAAVTFSVISLPLSSKCPAYSESLGLRTCNRLHDEHGGGDDEQEEGESYEAGTLLILFTSLPPGHRKQLVLDSFQRDVK